MLPSFINVYHPTVSRQCSTLSCLPVGSMYAIYIYMATWIPSMYPLYVSIYTSTMDPMGYDTKSS